MSEITLGSIMQLIPQYGIALVALYFLYDLYKKQIDAMSALTTQLANWKDSLDKLTMVIDNLCHQMNK